MPVWCRRLAEQGTNPSANSTEAYRSGQVGLAGSLKSLEAPLEGVTGLEVLDEVAAESGALTVAEAEESAVEASSSLSVSTKTVS